MHRCAFLVSLLALLVSLARAERPTACLQANQHCTEWVLLDGEGQRGLVYRTQSLSNTDPEIEHAVIVIHGQNRNADGYFRHMLAGASLTEAMKNTLIVSPRFASNQGGRCRDQLADHEVGWVCAGPESWRSGGAQTQSVVKKLNSYDFMDTLLSKLSAQEVFPKLRTIVIAGHSAGGQYVSRYQLSNRMHDKVVRERKIQLSYVIGNPSSYTYPGPLRPTRSAVPPDISASWAGDASAANQQELSPFVPFADAKSCTNFNSWPYGFEHRVGYAATVSDAVLTQQFAKREAIFLLGELDIYPVDGFDSTCAAMAQGPSRLARGLAYVKFAHDNLQAQHRAVVVPACGHDARCLFTAEKALPYLFLR